LAYSKKNCIFALRKEKMEMIIKKDIFKDVKIGALILTTASCGHDVLDNPMPQYYQESQGLVKTDVDSIHRFRDKFQSYLRKTPEAVSDNLYKPTVLNMRDAYRGFGVDLIAFGVNICITADTRWEGDTTFFFSRASMDSYIMSNNINCLGGQR